MLKIRLTEERIADEYKYGKMRCPTHLSIGQELAPGCIAEFVNNLSNTELSKFSENCLEFNRQENWEIYAIPLIELYESIKIEFSNFINN